MLTRASSIKRPLADAVEIQPRKKMKTCLEEHQVASNREVSLAPSRKRPLVDAVEIRPRKRRRTSLDEEQFALSVQKIAQAPSAEFPLQEKDETEHRKNLSLGEQHVAKNEEKASQTPSANSQLKDKRKQKSSCEEPVAVRQEHTAQVPPRKGARKDEGEQEPQKTAVKINFTENKNRMSQMKKSDLFQECSERLSARAPRYSFKQEIAFLSGICEDYHLPVLSQEEYHACLEGLSGARDRGIHRRFHFNQEKGLVLMYAKTPYTFRSMVREALVMKLLADHDGFQRLKGVYLKKRCLVTKNAGWNLFPRQLKAKHKYPIMLQIFRALVKLHQHDFAYNNLKASNICVKFTQPEPTVTLTSYRLITVSSSRPGIRSKSLFTPEPHETENPDRRGVESDALGLGKLLQQVYRSKEIPGVLTRWRQMSREASSSAGNLIFMLLRALREHTG